MTVGRVQRAAPHVAGSRRAPWRRRRDLGLERCAAAASITVPMSSLRSDGSPYVHALVWRAAVRRTRRRRCSCTSIRLTAVQRWPEFLYEPARSERRCLVEVGVLHDDDRIVAAKLQHLALVHGLRGDVLAEATPPVNVTRSTSGLTSISSAISRGSPVTTDSIGGGRPASYRMSASSERGQRRLFRRLQHHPVVRRDRRRDLVRHLIQRMVERRDRRNDAEQRLAQRVHLARLAVRRQVAGEHLAIVLQRRIAGKHEHVARATHLVERILLADAAFGRDQVRQRLGTTLDDLAAALRQISERS